MSKKYLYGASVQGIQQFIFQTNELKTIGEASDLVESICKDMFTEFEKGGEIIQKAAGNIRYLFSDEEACKRAVREFPRKVLTLVPGVTLSQAVVCFQQDDDFAKVKDKLEKKLHTQRNRPLRSMTIGLMGIERDRKSGLPLLLSKSGTHKNVTKTLCEKSFGAEELVHSSIPYNIEDMTGKNDWIAIIHADGNGLGRVVEIVSQRGSDALKSFSENLDKATVKAARSTYASIITGKEFENEKEKIPFRPVVLGGDDMTIICRADLAMDYAKLFMSNFEKYTKDFIGEELTACAGIAFVKSSYPFYYGYELAESLCSQAKKRAKAISEDKAPSCLMFHKVQSSFVEDYSEIIKKELTPQAGHSYVFGPYFLNPQGDWWTVGKLEENVHAMDKGEGNKAKSHIRQWMTLMSEDKGKAEQKSKRIEQVGSKKVKEVLDRKSVV